MPAHPHAESHQRTPQLVTRMQMPLARELTKLDPKSVPRNGNDVVAVMMAVEDAASSARHYCPKPKQNWQTPPRMRGKWPLCSSISSLGCHQQCLCRLGKFQDRKSVV